MSVSVGEVEAVLRLKNQFSAEINKATRDLTQFGASAQTQTGKVGLLERATKDLTSATTSSGLSFGKMVGAYVTGQAALNAAQAVFSTLVDVVSSSVQAYSDATVAQTKLTTAIRAQGTALPAAVQQYNALATSFQRTTTFSDDLITEMQALLIQVGNVMPTDMARALKASTDLAAGLGIDLRTATLLVGKAFAGETGTLKRYGIVINETALAARGADAVLDAIADKFGGQAQAQAETYAGHVQQIANAWDNVKEAMGRSIVEAPVMQAAMTAIKGAAEGADESANHAAISMDAFQLAALTLFHVDPLVSGTLEGWVGWLNDVATAGDSAAAMFDRLSAKSPFKAMVAGTDAGDLRNQLSQNMAQSGGIDFISAELAKSAKAQIDATLKTKEAFDRLAPTVLTVSYLFQGLKEELLPMGLPLQTSRALQGGRNGSLFGFTGGIGESPFNIPASNTLQASNAGALSGFFGAPSTDKAASFWSGFDWKSMGAAVGDSLLRAVQGGGSIGASLVLGGGGALLGGLASSFQAKGQGTSFLHPGGGMTAVGGAMGALSGAFAGWQTGQQYGSGKGALAGAASGAMAGAVGGPIGIGIGAAAGAIAGWLGGRGAWKKQREEFLAAAGGIEQLKKMADQAHISIDLLMSTNSSKVFQAELAKVTAAFKVQDEILTKQAEHAQLVVDTVSKISGLATPEQLKTLASPVPFGGKRSPEEMAALQSFMEGNTNRAASGIAKVAAGPITSQKGASGVTGALVATFGQMSAQGVPFLEIMKQLGPTIQTLTKKLTDMGLKGAEGFGQLSRMAGLLADEDIAGIVDSVSGLNDVLIGLSNNGLMTQEMFSGLGAQAANSFKALTDQGVKGSDALMLMQPTLQTLWELEQKFGFKADAATQKLIDQGVKSGIVGKNFKSDQEKMQGAIEDLIGRIGELIDALIGKGGVKEASHETKGDAVSDAAAIGREWKNTRGEVEKTARAIRGLPSTRVPSSGGPGQPPIPGEGRDETGHFGGFVSAAGIKFHHGGVVLPFVPKFHRGGLASNELPAILQHGEFVMQKRAVDRVGLATMRAINRGGSLGGGSVTHITVNAQGSYFQDASSEMRLAKAVARAVSRGQGASELRGALGVKAS